MRSNNENGSDNVSCKNACMVTIEDVRNMPEFADYSDEEAAELITAVVFFADIIYDLWSHNKDCIVEPVNFSQKVHKLA